MPNFPFTVGDSLRIGTADITASGGNIVLPSGTQVGNQPVATTVEVSTGGGPKITNIQVTSNVYVVLDDTAVDTAGGFIKITGTNFVTGCMVYVASTPANSTTFVNSTEVRAAVPATSAGTYPLYLVNPDGGTAIRVPGLTFSVSPAWQTASTLPEQYDGVAINLSLVATEATLYTLISGSLPPGLSLNSNTGVISGTITGVANDTVYSFTITATDAQLQDSPRTFTVTITVSDPYFKLTSLLLSGSAISANTVIRDSSTNNFNLSVFGDARARNFTPYGTGWSVYFDGSGDSLAFPDVAALNVATGDFTIEMWIYFNAFINDSKFYVDVTNAGTYWQWNYSTTNGIAFNVGGGFGFNQGSTTGWTTGTWYHVAFVRNASTFNIFRNGNVVATGTSSASIGSNPTKNIGGWSGDAATSQNAYISNVRFVKGVAVYTGNFVVPSSALTITQSAGSNIAAITGSQCSFLTGQSNRFVDVSNNTLTVTRNGDARVTSFNPFNITNTGVNGSMYFDGTGDYLTVAGNSGFAFGTGDFTIECWVNPDLINTATFDRICATSNYNGTGFDLTLNNGAAGLFLAGTSYGISSIPIKAWSHLVYTRSGTTVRGFLNGKLSSHTTGASQDISSTATLFIAHQGHAAGGSMLTGYLADLRIIKGSIPAAYQTASTTVGTQIFTPPAQPLTAISNTQLLTLQYDQPHNNHTFLDSSSNQFLITRSGNASQGTFSPFSPGGWSNYFNNASSIVCASNAAFAVGTGNFTVECFVNFSSTTVRNRFFCVGTSGTDGILLELNSGVLQVGIQNTYPINYTWAPIIGTWYHVAIVRTGTGANQVVLYIDGASVATGTSSASVSQNPVNIGGISWNSTWALLGYLSNVRFSNSARTITVPTSPYVSDANTLVLTCQSNRFLDQTGKTITVNSTPSVQAFSPFAATAVYNPAVHGGSAYFDGTGDCLTVPDNELLDLGTSNFTIELWIYLTASVATAMVLAKTPNSSTYGSYEIRLSSTTVVMFLGSTGSSWDIASAVGTGTTSLNSWTHIALVRSASTFTLYVNGNASGTATSSSSLFNNTSALGIAANPDASYPYTGYISNFRVIKGTALYTSNFTPPTAPVTATTNTSLLLNFTDAAIIDSTGRNVLETVADAKTSSVVTKFTGGSMYFDGTGDYVRFPTSERFQLLAGSSTTFTIEAWIYKLSNPSSGNQYPLITTLDIQATYYGYYFSISDAGKLVFSHYYNGNNQVASRIGNTALASNTWYHVVLVASAGTFKIYVNGIEDAPYSDTNTASLGNTSQQLATAVATIGGPSVGAPSWQIPFNGYISDFRITRGYARYTANFTAPTAPARLK